VGRGHDECCFSILRYAQARRAIGTELKHPTGRLRYLRGGAGRGTTVGEWSSDLLNVVLLENLQVAPMSSKIRNLRVSSAMTVALSAFGGAALIVAGVLLGHFL
jgi:hypothetical protein